MFRFRCTVFTALALFATQALGERIISLSPSITEILFELNLQDSIVGVSEYTDHPERAKTIPRVGAYNNPNKEKLLSLRPDIVLVTQEGLDELTPFLKRAGLRYKELRARNLSDYPGLVRDLAKTFHRQDEGEILIKKWNLDWQGLAPQKAMQTAALVLDVAPVIAVGGDSFLSEVAARCGLRNVYHDQHGYPAISRELLASTPFDRLVLLIEEASRPNAENLRNLLSKTRKLKTTWFSPKDISILGPRLPDAAKKFCAALKKDSAP